jgi:hypothetical protein
MTSTGSDPISSPPAVRAGQASAKVRFLLAMSGVCTSIVVIGWVSDLRGVLHGMLLALSLAAFLPLLVVSPSLKQLERALYE